MHETNINTQPPRTINAHYSFPVHDRCSTHAASVDIISY